MREIEWTGAALDDMAALDKGIARRIQQAVERFAATGAGNVRKLQGIDPPEYRRLRCRVDIDEGSGTTVDDIRRSICTDGHRGRKHQIQAVWVKTRHSSPVPPIRRMLSRRFGTVHFDVRQL